ncbi:MAG: CRISPR-associated RAMP protein [Candidatus Aramenus sulfurataquae]|nr:MAG: CRISPR-associated RAMP protein [Candidatus Aramenus sulfurataquae]
MSTEPKGADFDKLSVIIDIKGNLINETPLRIGGATRNRFESASDSPIVKIGDIPYIPGSTLKGALRSLAEVYAKTRGWEVVYPYEENEKIENKKIEDCVTCLLFGSKLVSSRIYVFDALLNKDALPNEKEVRIGIRTMVGINRTFGAAQPKMIYTLDYVEPYSVFDFKMRIINLNFIKIEEEKEEWKKKGKEVLEFLISELKQGIMIGSRKSVGYGLVKLQGVKCSVKKLENGKIEVKEVEEC